MVEYRILENEFGEFAVSLVEFDLSGVPVTAARVPVSRWFETLDALELTLRRKLEATYRDTINIEVFK